MMTTTTWSAVSTLDRVFDEVLRSALKGPDTARFPVAADIREKNDAYTFQFDVPGVKTEDLEITLENRVLAIRGVRRFVGDESQKVTLGRPHGRFEMSYALPDGIEGEKLTADLAEGVLTIRVPKHARVQARKIQVRSGADGNQLVE